MSGLAASRTGQMGNPAGLKILADHWRQRGWSRDEFVLMVLCAGLGEDPLDAGAAWDEAPEFTSVSGGSDHG